MKLYDIAQYAIIAPEIVRWTYYTPFANYQAEMLDGMAKGKNGEECGKLLQTLELHTLGGIMGALACSKDYGLFSDTDILRMSKEADDLREEFHRTFDDKPFCRLMDMYSGLSEPVDMLEELEWGEDGAKGTMRKHLDWCKDSLTAAEKMKAKKKIKEESEEELAEDIGHICRAIAKDIRNKYAADAEVRFSAPYEKIVKEASGDSISSEASGRLQAILGIPDIALPWCANRAEHRRDRYNRLVKLNIPSIIEANEKRMVREAEAYLRAAEERCRQGKDGKADDEGAKKIVEEFVKEVREAHKECMGKMRGNGNEEQN